MYRVVFMGTPAFAVPALEALLAATDLTLVAVVTQPDRPAGRGKTLQQSPVKQRALAANLPVLQPEKLRAPGVFEQLAAYAPDLIVVAAFGQILRQNVLSLPRFGCINVHASLLPRWRGAAPIQAAIRAGDTETGITIMQMDAGLDTGAMLHKAVVSIAANETGDSLHNKLAPLGGSALISVLPGYLAGSVQPEAQPNGDFGYAAMLKKEDGQIDWAQPALQIDRQVRALYAWPGAYSQWQNAQIKILPATDSASQVGAGSAAPGQVIRLEKALWVGTGDGLYRLGRLQVPGKSQVSATDFANGQPQFVGSQLG
jgi:methionyl-tRNA formyltransferase